MLDSTLDLISQAVSNNLYVFCLFNLIIFMIFMGSKHGSNFHQDYEIPLSGSTAPTYDKQDLEVKQLVNRSKLQAARNAISRVVPSAYETATEDNKGNRNGCNANSTDDGDEDEDEDEGDDELRRKVEEFIGKVNREWRAEKLGMSISA